MQQAAKRVEIALSRQHQPSSESHADRNFYVSFGLIISARLGDVDGIRGEIERLGGKIAFQTVSNGPLYLLREYQIVRALQGDTSHLREVHDRKQRERRVEKKIE